MCSVILVLCICPSVSSQAQEPTGGGPGGLGQPDWLGIFQGGKTSSASPEADWFYGPTGVQRRNQYCGWVIISVRSGRQRPTSFLLVYHGLYLLAPSRSLWGASFRLVEAWILHYWPLLNGVHSFLFASAGSRVIRNTTHNGLMFSMATKGCLARD